jgi:hypothetical protein
LETICEQVKHWNGAASHEEALSFFDRLCESYLQADPPLRNEIRQAVTGNSTVYQSLLYDSLSTVGSGPCLAMAAERAETETNYVAYLRSALLTISLTGGFGDWRDTILWLARLHEEALKRGIDPEPHFEEIAALSDSENQHGISGMSTRELIWSGGGVMRIKRESREKAAEPGTLGVHQRKRVPSYNTASGAPEPQTQAHRPWWRFWG